MCSHLNCSCSQQKRCGNSSSIRNSSGCNDRNRNRIYNLRHQNHRRILSDMTSGFCPFCHNRVCPAALHPLRHCYRCDNRNHFHTRRFPHLHIFFRIPSPRRHNRDSFLDNNLCHLVRIRTHKHNIHTKWLVCKLLHFSDLLTHPFWRRTCCSNQSQTSGF